MALRPRSALFKHQVAAAEAIVHRRKVALLLAPGYGKTAATLTALGDMNARLSLGSWPALVVAPATVTDSVWGQEAALWEHLRNVAVTPLVGSPARRRKLLRETSHVEVVSYENLEWLTDEVDLDSRYRAVVFDELSKMKAAGSKRFTRMRHRGTRIPIRVGLTGTPVENHLLDLWGELYMVGGKEPLGPTFTNYQAQYFWPTDPERHRWELRHPEYEREIHQRAAPWCYVLPPAPEVRVPEVRLVQVEVPMPPAYAKATAELRRHLVTLLDGGAEVEALTAGARAQKLRQMAGGAVYFGDYDEVKLWAPLHDAKLTALGNLLDELQGEPLLVFYWYQHERDRLVSWLKRRGVNPVLAGEPNWIENWNARRIEVLLAHPQSAGHGLNLQGGGSHLCWYTLPWSHGLRVQGEGRLARTGQRAEFVVAHALMCGEVDAAVLRALDRKAETERRFLDSVKENT